jgi:uncharacterized protein YkwD
MSPNRDVWTTMKRVSAVPFLGLGVVVLCLLTTAGCTFNNSTTEDSYDASSVPSLPEGASMLSELNPVERSLLWRANEARRKAGDLPLTLQPDLCRVARQHNAYMTEQSRITLTRNGSDIGEQLHDQGVNWNLCAVNLARVSPHAPNVAQKAVDLWLKDPIDRKDLLYHLFTETGIAAQQDPKTGKWFLTQIYARRTGYYVP